MRIQSVTKRALAGVFGTAIVLLSLNVLRLWFTTSHAAASVAVPYTVTLTQTMTYPSGQTKHMNTVVYALRSDGSMAAKQSTAIGSKQPEVFRTIFLSSGVAIQSRDLAGLISTGAGGAAAPLRSPVAQCVLPGDQASGIEIQDGYRAAKVMHGGQTSWFALDYGCALVRSRITWDNGAFNEKRLVALVKGEPDPALFHIADGYREVPPSQWHYRDGAEIPQSDRNLMKKLDDQYYKQRPPAK